MNYINISRESDISISRQLYQYYKEQIISGILAEGDRLPSTRTLKEELGISRNVVVDCYEQLIAEGYVNTKNGSGTYVNRIARLDEDKSNRVKFQSDRVYRHIISFRTGIPDLMNIPVKKWVKSYSEQVILAASKELDYQKPEGNDRLRGVIAKYLMRARGVNTTLENIVITCGAAQAFSIVSKLVEQDEYVLVENPLSQGLLKTLEGNKLQIKRVDVDEDGMITKNLPEHAPKLIFTSPSHQFPMGVVLKINRRIELVQYARENNCYIVEDDYDSEFRFDGYPVESMQQLDPSRVIYTGTFSKTLMPALRIGYLVLPDALVDSIRKLKYIDDIHSSNLEQLALADFIDKGYFERHIRNMKKLYLRKRKFLADCLQKVFGNAVTIVGENAGLHFTAEFYGYTFTKEMMNRIHDAGIEITEVKCNKQNQLIFGYGNTKIEDMRKGVILLNKTLNNSEKS